MKSALVFLPDDRQREAIEHVQGPMLVIAGAGTGKTTVLTRRMVRLIREGHVLPGEILAMTYTDNAAAEMRERVRAEISQRHISGPQIATFHAYCHNLLIRCGKQFGVLDEKDLWIFLRKRIHELQLDHFIIPANVGKFLDDLLSFMRRCQDELVGPEKYAQYVERLERGEVPIPRTCKSKDADLLNDEEVVGRCREIARVFAKVEEMLRTDNLGTFGHMITRAYELLLQDPALLAREQQHARFILVDEFQDANFAQVKILSLLAGEKQNVFAVGDPDQAIYRFRGASSAAFDLFRHNFSAAKLVSLEKNRRSTTPILRCAHALISRNPTIATRTGTFSDRDLRSPLVSAREEYASREGGTLQSPPVEIVPLTGKDLECSDIVAVIRQRQKQLRCKWGDFAILYRQHLHRDEIVHELAEAEIPFSIENMDVMDVSEVRDLLACIRAAVSDQDDASLLRVAARPQFNIDPNRLRAAISSLPREQDNAKLVAVLAQVEGGSGLLQRLADVREEIASRQAKACAAVEIAMRRFGFDRGLPPLAAVLEFVRAWESKPITKSKEIAELIDYLEYFREAHGVISLPSTESNAVHLMTAHGAKGLEFDHVFIIRANSNSFPASYKESLVEFPRELRDPDSVDLQDDKVLHEQEERRLFYVAMTRARDSLTIYAKRGTGKTDPSPPGYVRELVKDVTISRYLCQRQARGFQTDLFGTASHQPATPIAAWVGIPPALDLASRLSASAVQAYETCPLQFKLEREWRIPGEVPAAMQYGATMHRVLRAYYDSVRFGQPMMEESLIEFFCADLAQAAIQDRYQHALYENQGIEQLREFLTVRRRAPVPEVLHTEEFFEMRVGESNVVGRIDRIDKLPDGQIVITDYKTGRPQSQEDADNSLQLSIYALAAREKWGYRADYLSFYNLEENSSVITHRGEGELEAAKLKVLDVAKDIAAGKFEPTPGFHCRFCAYRNLCPATEKHLYQISVAAGS